MMSRAVRAVARWQPPQNPRGGHILRGEARKQNRGAQGRAAEARPEVLHGHAVVPDQAPPQRLQQCALPPKLWRAARRRGLRTAEAKEEDLALRRATGAEELRHARHARLVDEALAVQHKVARLHAAPPFRRQVVHEGMRRGHPLAARAEAAQLPIEDRAEQLDEHRAAGPLRLHEDGAVQAPPVQQELHQLVREVVAVPGEDVVRVPVVAGQEVLVDELHELLPRPPGRGERLHPLGGAKRDLAVANLGWEDAPSIPVLRAEGPYAGVPDALELLAAQGGRRDPLHQTVRQVVHCHLHRRWAHANDIAHKLEVGQSDLVIQFHWRG
mmetsp:Transcript_58460/g.156492  ORF Transcript_58460/g.156492 Transcript_58460/m.156492 type:complete len:327 (-) Transcript_58460:308-1288(-)